MAMAGSCWRLLAVFSLIFVCSMVVAPVFLRGQDDAVARLPASVPAIPQVLAPIVAPKLAPPRYSPPIAPVWIPPPSAPRRYPVVPQRPVLSQLVYAAGIIFSGRVTSIGRASSASGHASSSTNVTFEVEHAMRGTSPGESLTIREWASLWTGGEHYRVGEHLLLFLYPPSKLGLTSPVAGALGRFAVDSQGRIVMNARQGAALAADPVLTG